MCIGLMIAIWLCRIGGIPIFGEPVLTKEEKAQLSDGRPVPVTGVVTERRISSRTIRYTLRQVRATICGREIPFSGLFVSTEYTAGNGPAEPGDILQARGELRPLESARNPGQFDAAGYYACFRIYYRLWSEDPPEVHRRQSIRKWLFRLRETLTETYAARMHEDQAGILSAMLLGDKAFLSEESRRNFQAGGCLHLLVISGLHVMLLGMGLLQILLRVRLPQTAACILTAGVMISYTALTGFPVASVRACIMFLILLLGRVKRLSYDSASSMSLAAVLLLLAEPGYLFHAGFQLSFAAAAAASLVSPLLTRCVSAWFDTEKGADEIAAEEQTGQNRSRADERNRDQADKRNRSRAQVCGRLRILLRAARESIILWGAVQLCTLPLTAYYFFEIPAWSLPLNLLLVPCVQYVLAAGVFGSLAALVFSQAGKVFLFPADLGLGLFDLVLGLARILPGGSVVCGRPALWQIAVYYTILVIVLRILHRSCGKKHDPWTLEKKRQPESRRKIIAAALAMAAGCTALFFRTYPAFSLTALDVGQGDCIAVQTGKTVLLSDGGSTNVQEVGKYRILPYLESKGISYVSICCISHNDADHMNGIEELLRMIRERKTALKIGCICMPEWMKQTENGMRIAAEAHAVGAETRWLQRGSTMLFGDLRVDVLHPFQQDDSASPTGGAQAGNAGSVVLQVSYHGFTTLLTGDLEKEGEEELLPYLSDIDCLKAGHHGSRWSSSKEFLEVTRPEIALISAPAKSMYGHPHQEALDRLDTAGATIFATKDCGAVEIRVNRSGAAQVFAYLYYEY